MFSKVQSMAAVEATTVQTHREASAILQISLDGLAPFCIFPLCNCDRRGPTEIRVEFLPCLKNERKKSSPVQLPATCSLGGSSPNGLPHP